MEPCCGTAALTLHLLGAPKRLVGYQGGKFGLRRQLGHLAESLGFVGAPSHVVLSDASIWAETIRSVLVDRAAVLAHLDELRSHDPLAVHHRLYGGPVPKELTRRAAEHLWLQSVSFAQAAVRTEDGRWKARSRTVARSDLYGAIGANYRIRPEPDVLADAIRALPAALPTIEASVGTARARGRAELTLVYLDPPYHGTAGYGHDLPRPDVVALALEWAQSGATVLVSEGGPVTELAARGWQARQLDGRAGGRGRRACLVPRRTREEWVTASREVAHG